MSRSDVPMKMRKSTAIADPTDAEIDAMYDEFDWCAVPERATGSSMHLSLGDGEPLCALANQDRASSYREVPIGVYPKRFKNMCNFCAHVWRGDSPVGDDWRPR